MHDNSSEHYSGSDTSGCLFGLLIGALSIPFVRELLLLAIIILCGCPILSVLQSYWYPTSKRDLIVDSQEWEYFTFTSLMYDLRSSQVTKQFFEVLEKDGKHWAYDSISDARFTHLKEAYAIDPLNLADRMEQFDSGFSVEYSHLKDIEQLRKCGRAKMTFKDCIESYGNPIPSQYLKFFEDAD